MDPEAALPPVPTPGPEFRPSLSAQPQEVADPPPRRWITLTDPPAV